MIIQERRQDFTDRNRAYNNRVSTLIGDILGTHKIYPDYLPVAEFSPALPSAAQSSRDVHVVKEVASPKAKEGATFDTNGLGGYENIIFSSLAWGAYNIYCIVGEMGSGKTATAKQIEEVLRRQRPKRCGRCEAGCTPVVIRLDFNEGFTSDNTEVLLLHFKKRLYQQLKIFLRDLFKHTFSVDLFVAYVRKRENFNTLAAFDDLVEEIEAEGSWKTLTNIQRAHRLFAFIKAQDDVEVRVELLMLLLRYVSLHVLPEPACVVVIYDNLDKLKYEAQMAVLFTLMGFQSMAEIRALVPLRRTSFEKLASQRVYSFGVINHTGPSPLEIIRRRLDHFLQNFDSEPLTRTLDTSSSTALRRRIRYVLSVISHDTGRVLDIVRAVPGDSVRLGLFMMERAFVNTISPFDGDPSTPGELARALLVGEGADQRLTLSDEVVANVFCDGRTFHPSLLLMRILGILYEFDGIASRRTLGNVVALLREIGGWNTREVLHGLNYLMYWKRPLIWADGRSEFKLGKEAKEELPSKETLFLTRAGERYFRHLAMELSYFQECAITLEWPAGDAPSSMDVTDIESRMAAIRSCFVAIQKMDQAQFVRFRDNLKRMPSQPLKLILLSNRILFGIARAALRMFEAYRRDRGVTPTEWLNWHSQIVVSLNLEEELTGGTRNVRLGELEKAYKASLSGS